MLVSVPLLELMTNDVPATILAVGASRLPTVPPAVFLDTKMTLLAVTAVVLIVIVPPVMAADVPTLALDPVAIFILLPAVKSATFPVTSTLSVGTVVDPKPNAPTCVE